MIALGHDLSVNEILCIPSTSNLLCEPLARPVITDTNLNNLNVTAETNIIANYLFCLLGFYFLKLYEDILRSYSHLFYIYSILKMTRIFFRIRVALNVITIYVQFVKI